MGFYRYDFAQLQWYSIRYILCTLAIRIHYTTRNLLTSFSIQGLQRIPSLTRDQHIEERIHTGNQIKDLLKNAAPVSFILAVVFSIV